VSQGQSDRAGPASGVRGQDAGDVLPETTAMCEAAFMTPPNPETRPDDPLDAAETARLRDAVAEARGDARVDHATVREWLRALATGERPPAPER